jgi:hypothetical protein
VKPYKEVIMPEELLELLEAWNPRAARHLRENCRRREAASLSREARDSMSTDEKMQHAAALIDLDKDLREDWRSCWCQ